MSHSNETSNPNYAMYDNQSLHTMHQQQYERFRRSPRATAPNLLLNSPELAEVHVQPQHVKVGRSPINLRDNSSNSTGSIDYVSLCSSENIVVYDDIGHNWVFNRTDDEQQNIIGEPCSRQIFV